MPPEAPRQIDMFTGEQIDTRMPQQKRRDSEKARPRQAEMFLQREIAQFGVRARPHLPITPRTRLELAISDPRTDEQRARDRQREAERLTGSLFEAHASPVEPVPVIPDTPLDDLAIASLEAMRKDTHSRQYVVDDYMNGLWGLWYAVRDGAILARANHIWARYDEAALVATFEQFAEDNAFSFDPGAAEDGQAAWVAVWQLAIEDVEANPPSSPAFSRAAVQAWLEQQ